MVLNWTQSPAVPVEVLRLTILETTSLKQTVSFPSQDSPGRTTFNRTFDEAGAVKVSAITSVNPESTLELTVTVAELESSAKDIRVFVRKFEAENILKEERRRRHDSNTTNSTDSNGTPNFPVQFLYSPNRTPIVHAVEPRMGSRQDTIFTIHGTRFSSFSDENVVTFGGHRCLVLSASSSSVSCTLDPQSHPTSMEILPLTLRVIESNKGYAFIEDSSKSSIQVLPVIHNISPPLGSLCGGTDVVITGDTLPIGTEQVHLGPFPCKVTIATYTELHCTTQPSEARVFDVTFYNKDGEPIRTLCNASTSCTFTFSRDHTPLVNSVSLETGETESVHIISLGGHGFSEIPEENIVRLGERACEVVESGLIHLICRIEFVPASDYEIEVRICNLTGSRCFGCAMFEEGLEIITVEGEVSEVFPTSGGTLGGAEVLITGHGFHMEETSVFIGEEACAVMTTSFSSITCITPPHSSGEYDITVISDGTTISGPLTEPLTYDYSISDTPRVNGINPTSGQQGEVVTITGVRFGDAPSSATVEVVFGRSLCELDPAASSADTLTCRAGRNFAGEYTPRVTVRSLGLADTADSVTFTYLLIVDSISVNEGSFAGQNTLTVHGIGFHPIDTPIFICEQLSLPTSTIPSLTDIEVSVPSIYPVTNELVCDIRVGTEVTDYSYTYRDELTPKVHSINSTRGGTQGGTAIRINGEQFSGSANVSIAGSTCIVVSQTDSEIVCVTEASSRTVRAVVQVYIDGMGFALSNCEFWYVDLWSSNFTWGGGPLPREGDFVVIQRDQTVVLDTQTPVLSFLLISGGELIFDNEAEDNQIALQAQRILITSGGRLQIGSEEEPFYPRARIVLFGHRRSQQLPVYGTKVLALREGEITIHGRPLNCTWTALSKTAAAGDTKLYLKDWVTWESGGEIVVATTSFSQRENEELTIDSVEWGESGSILHLTSPLRYDHISIQQVIAGKVIDTCAEVAYLTRNIIFRGNLNEEWSENIPACEEEFRAGQFETQTCFRGRFGNETASDQFGGQMFIHAAVKDQNHVRARISYVEFTHVGQAFALGRYAIHFHLNGNVSGSLVRGCSIHHSFNRAVTIHAVSYLLVEKNVAYNILGHAYFLEDGNEEYNIIQDNLAVFVRTSSSLLNVDTTPASYWIVNPNNIVRGNAAAGGTHFGFWYRIPLNPTGPSADPSKFPRKQPVQEFSGNSAHSFGRYGLWVFPHYHPSAPSYFDNFLSWLNLIGVEFAETGSLQLRNSIIMDNILSGVEVIEVDTVWDEEEGALIRDTIIVGHSEISANVCTNSGIKTPHTYYLIVSNVTFVNFDRPECYPIRACAHCKNQQGGFETWYRVISYINCSSKITLWQWKHEHIHRDLDGTLTRTLAPALLIPTNELLDPALCSPHPESSDQEAGSICNGSLEFGRVTIFNPIPSSLEFSPINVTNDHGTTVLNYVFRRLFHSPPGHMAQLELNTTSGFTVTWVEGESLTNVSYGMMVTGFDEEDYVIVTQHYPQPLDQVDIAGVTQARNSSILADPNSASSGDFSLENNDTSLTYIIKGTLAGPFTVSGGQCFHDNCSPPPPPTLASPLPDGRPENGTLLWSNMSIWPNNQFPQEGDDVRINASMYVIVDTELPRLGTLVIDDGAALELMDEMDHVIEASLIVINGRFVVGYPDVPFVNKVRILLHGTETPTFSDPRLGSRATFSSTRLGSGAIGVFGQLILTGRPHAVLWTLLSETAWKGSGFISVLDSVDWAAGDHIVITSTSYDAYQTEVFSITNITGEGHTLFLNGTLEYTHAAVPEYSASAEVGLLTRNIVIGNADPVLSDDEASGCRVLVSQVVPFVGSVMLKEVQFEGCGQLGFTSESDPRFALAFVDVGVRGTDSYIQECSFCNGYNTAIGIFGTDGVLVECNVIHSTVGPAMIVTGTNHTVLKNLASLSQFIGTYRERNEPDNSLWTANFEMTDTTALTFIGNHAAGGAKASFHVNGEDCSDDDDSSPSSSVVRHNVGHSALHCIHLGYSDGEDTNCFQFSHFTVYSCYHYGLFSYSPAGIRVVHCTFLNNKAAVYVSVIGPPALSHVAGSKYVVIEHTDIVAGGNFTRCENEAAEPLIASHPRSHHGIRAPMGGVVGVVIPTFVSGRGLYPGSPWFSISTYPAIGGLSVIESVRFIGFSFSCDHKRNVLLITNPRAEDANHPVHLENIQFQEHEVADQSLTALKTYFHFPSINNVNPSDCVDMECDGLKVVILKDIDGSFTETGSFHTIVPIAEFEWDRDVRRGIGDYRIPQIMLTNQDSGSRIDVDALYPLRGIIRGIEPGSESECTLHQDWNGYLCSELDHLLMVMESLDIDTEERRLSPIGVGGNGFINLNNGPMDHGWCGGYTCQERISTFYIVVVSGFNFTIGLTGSNPRKTMLRLLNSNEQQGIMVALIYNSPQRLDVYNVSQDGTEFYVTPNNGFCVDDSLQYRMGTAEEFVPAFSDEHCSNFYDRMTSQLHVALRGDIACKIKTVPVIMLSLTVSVDVADFFDPDFLMRNIGLLLNIPSSKIRVVNVVRESKRRRRQVMNEVQVDLEVGDSPLDNSSSLSAEDLVELGGNLTEILQTGQLNETILSAEMDLPSTEELMETVRATNTTGGPQPGEVPEGTATFSELQREEEEERAEEEEENSQFVLSIPYQLITERIVSTGGFEGLPLSGSLAPQVAMVESDGDYAEQLGLTSPWELTALLEEGPEDAFLLEASADFYHGFATFDRLVFSHAGDYRLGFMVTYPTSAEFSTHSSQVLTVSARDFGIEIIQQPQDGNTTFRLYPYPVVNLIDLSNGGSLASDLSWRGTEWFMEAIVENADHVESGHYTVQLINGVGIFRDILVGSPGSYVLRFQVLEVFDDGATFPRTQLSSASQHFSVRELTSVEFLFVYVISFQKRSDDGDEGRNEELEEQFEEVFSRQYPEVEVINITSTHTPRVVIFAAYVTAQSSSDLTGIICSVLKNPSATELTLALDNQVLTLLSVNSSLACPAGNHSPLIISLSVIFTMVFLIVTAVVVVVVIVWWRKRQAYRRRISLVQVQLCNCCSDVNASRA